MKKETLILIAAILLTGVAALHSQNSSSAKSPVQMLKALKASNAALIDKQKKTLESLGEMQKTADQVRIFASRS